VSSMRVLVVDDEELVCATMQTMLEFAGHVVVTAAAGREAALEAWPESLARAGVLYC
jgi:CheY-like chemotaxis protein